MNNSTAPSPFASATSPGFTNEMGYIIVLSLGVLVVVLTIGFACYFCQTYVLITPTSVLSQRRSSPIALQENPSRLVPKQGLDEGTLGNYPKLLYSEVKLKYGNLLAGSCCPICLADYGEDEMLLLLPDCGHFFHIKCANRWLLLHPTCPVCRNSQAERIHIQI
ncbi:hypothetical protein TIFTF001_033257 [Ficus carica]|uniref:RING-type domain-containing protein n=1 Tax=Ficus carica TaxID=3494 RepID=A0AA88E4Z4_FICCA|nr:hypothetical protein TIFTF001_033257 [Ficus carica]